VILTSTETYIVPFVIEIGVLFDAFLLEKNKKLKKKKKKHSWLESLAIRTGLRAVRGEKENKE
jgi:hypothetical protein